MMQERMKDIAKLAINFSRQNRFFCLSLVFLFTKIENQ